jgi:hypothetical protein
MTLTHSAAKALAATGVVSPRSQRYVDACNERGQFVAGITLHTTVSGLTAATKRAGTRVEKVQTITGGITTGSEYKNHKQNADTETGALPGNQEWVIYPYISRNPETGQEYARVYIDSRKAKYETQYYVDGVCVGDRKSAVKDYMTASAYAGRPTDPDKPVYTLGPKIESVVAVNGVTL